MTKPEELAREYPLKSGYGFTALGCLASLVLASCVGCGTPAQPGTAMSSACRELPTVVECSEGAKVIKDDLLRGCVRQQCTRIKINCGDMVRAECRRQSQLLGGAVLGYTLRIRGSTFYAPTDEIYWCEESSDAECRLDALIHELAHSCGWRHLGGRGVPGDEGTVTCE